MVNDAAVELYNTNKNGGGARDFCEFHPDSGTLVTPHGVQTIRSKTRSLLLYLIMNKGKTISADELRSVVWGRVHGAENGPKQCIRELRLLLSDEAKKPSFIETVGRNGYRLVGDIRLVHARQGRGQCDEAAISGPATDCFGRERELAMLANGFEQAQSGTHGVYMLTGELGAGKTTIINHFISSLQKLHNIPVLWGQCVPYSGTEEAYGPLLEMLARASMKPERAQLRQLLQERAPSWVAQLPGVFPARLVKERQIELVGTGPSRMPRELTFVIEELARAMPVVLVLEDLHWSDPSTLSWIRTWSLRPIPCRLMIVCSARPGADLAKRLFPSPASGEALRRGRLAAISISGMSTEAVRSYLNRKFPQHDFPEDFADNIVQRTSGHALFVDALVSEWQANGEILQRDGVWSLGASVDSLMNEVTPTTRSLIDSQVADLSPDERRLLQMASVVGIEFPAAGLARSTEDTVVIERQCENLVARCQFIQRSGTFTTPGMEASTSYRFRHALYQQAVYDGIPHAARAELHAHVGACLENACGRGAVEIAPVLANHFELAGHYSRAAKYRQRIAAVSLQRGANREAEQQARRGLALMPRIHENQRRRWIELRLQVQLAAASIVNDGFATTTVSDALNRIQKLLAACPDEKLRLLTLIGLWNFHLTRAELKRAQAIAAGLTAELENQRSPQLLMAIHNAVGAIRWIGGDLAAAVPHIEATRQLYDREKHGSLSRIFGEDPGVVCRKYGMIVYQMLGQPEIADELYQEGLEIAHALNQPFGLAQMQWGSAIVARQRGDPDMVRRHATELIDICERADSRFWLPGGQILAGWAEAKTGNVAAGIQQLEAGIRTWSDMGISLTRPVSLSLLADSYREGGEIGKSRRVMTEALNLIETTGERWFMASAQELALTDSKP